MALYKIEWTREQWFVAYVDADSAKEAEDKFWLGETGEATLFGEEIQEGVDVEAVE
jgi:hypothetical protein